MYDDKLSGLQTINVKAVIELAEKVQMEFENYIEISLDCAICLALNRTIKVNENQEYGVCIKTNHQFTVRINSQERNVEKNRATIVYQIEYWYAPFVDRKYNQKSRCLPTWGRLHFSLFCPKCLTKQNSSLQTNIVRPWTKYCKCGKSLYSEINEMPIFEKIV